MQQSLPAFFLLHVARSRPSFCSAIKVNAVKFMQMQLRDTHHAHNSGNGTILPEADSLFPCLLEISFSSPSALV